VANLVGDVDADGADIGRADRGHGEEAMLPFALEDDALVEDKQALHHLHYTGPHGQQLAWSDNVAIEEGKPG